VAAQNEERLRLGVLWEDQGLIFPGRTGNPSRPWSLTCGPYLRLLARAGLPEKTRFHDLRHAAPQEGRTPQVRPGPSPSTRPAPY
jgi:hypothetical protein